MGVLGTVIVGLAIAVGLVGVVVPILPGAFLVLGAIVVWSAVERTATGWIVLAVAFGAIAVTQVLKYVIPGRRLRDAGVPNASLIWGGIAGIVGFFVIPVIGLPIGFALGVYGAERQRLGSDQAARPSTIAALKAVGLSILIELVGALAAAAVWVAGVIAS